MVTCILQNLRTACQADDPQVALLQVHWDIPTSDPVLSLVLQRTGCSHPGLVSRIICNLPRESCVPHAPLLLLIDAKAPGVSQEEAMTSTLPGLWPNC